MDKPSCYFSSSLPDKRALLHALWQFCLAISRLWTCRAACRLMFCGFALVGTASDSERMQQFVSQHYGVTGVQALLDWRESLRRGGAQTEFEKLVWANDFFNRRVKFQEDLVVWSLVDYWATPLEFLGKGAGDCEDFAIAKYFSLIEMGVPAARLRLTYVRARIGAPGSEVTLAHMILSYYARQDAEPLILDNLISEIRQASRRPDLTPVFSFNSGGVWMAGSDRPTSPVDRLSRWKDLVIRMKAQGYEP